MRADSLAIIDHANNTLWVRGAATSLTDAFRALRQIGQQVTPHLELVRSFTDKHGNEQFVEFLTDAAIAASTHPNTEFSTVEIWHANPPRFFFKAGDAIDSAEYTRAADLTLATEADESMLDTAFARSQNVDRHWNVPKPCRSTSVGDVLVVRRGETRSAYAVCSIGFHPCTFN